MKRDVTPTIYEFHSNCQIFNLNTWSNVCSKNIILCQFNLFLNTNLTFQFIGMQLKKNFCFLGLKIKTIKELEKGSLFDFLRFLANRFQVQFLIQLVETTCPV